MLILKYYVSCHIVIVCALFHVECFQELQLEQIQCSELFPNGLSDWCFAITRSCKTSVMPDHLFNSKNNLVKINDTFLFSL